MRIDRTMRIDQLPQFLRVGELMTYLGIGRALAYALAREHGVKVGRKLRIPREKIHDITKRHESSQNNTAGGKGVGDRNGEKANMKRHNHDPPVAATIAAPKNADEAERGATTHVPSRRQGDDRRMHEK